MFKNVSAYFTIEQKKKKKKKKKKYMLIPFGIIEPILVIYGK